MQPYISSRRHLFVILAGLGLILALLLLVVLPGVAYARTTYTVSGAGTAAVNQIYTQVANGSWGGAVYLSADGNYIICSNKRPTPDYWAITDSVDCGDTGQTYYVNMSSSPTPPLTGWGMGWGSGSPPWPVLSLSSGGGAWSALDCGTNGTVTAILHSAGDNDLYIGGWTFENVGCSAMAARNVARFNKPTSTWHALGSGLNAGIWAVAQVGTDIYYGGEFTQTGDGSTNLNRIARWSTTTNTWSPIIVGGINGVSARVMSLAAYGDNLYVGGDFQTAGSTTVNCIARYNTTSNTWNTMGPNPGAVWTCSIRALAISDDGNSVYAGGRNTLFQTTTSISRGIARWNYGTPGTWTAFDDNSGYVGINGGDNLVNGIALIGSDVYLAGNFTLAGNSLSVNNMVKWNFGSPYGAWSRLGSGTNNGAGGEVRALAAGAGSVLYTAGDNAKAYSASQPYPTGVSLKYVGGWYPATSDWASVGGGTDYSTWSESLSSDASELCVGGAYYYAGSTLVSNIACWGEATNMDFGDLPSNYPVKIVQNGPRHSILSGAPYLGAVAPDAEVDGQPNATATGDDSNGTNDEGGVTRAAGKAGGSGWSNGTVASGQGGAVNVTISAASACLGALMDFDASGSLSAVTLRDASGAAVSQPLAAGSYTFYFDVPAGTFAGSGGNPTIYSLFRVTSPISGSCAGSAANSATGAAADGEVESYAWGFTPNAITLRSFEAQTLKVSETFRVWGLGGLVLLDIGVAWLIWRRMRRNAKQSGGSSPKAP